MIKAVARILPALHARLLSPCGPAGNLTQSGRSEGAEMEEPPVIVRPEPSYAVEKYGRYWAVRDAQRNLVCLTVYKRGATEVVRRLTA